MTNRRWTRSVTNLTRCMSPWQSWPKWEMGRFRTFKRLGAHAHRDSSRPRDLQKARGGRSDPRASYPNPATSGRGGKITQRHPHLPAMESLSPALRRLVNDQCGSEAKTLAELMVQEGVTTCQAAACHADSGTPVCGKVGLSEHWPPERVETCRRGVRRTPRSMCPRGKSSPHAHDPCSEPPLPCSR